MSRTWLSWEPALPRSSTYAGEPPLPSGQYCLVTTLPWQPLHPAGSKALSCLWHCVQGFSEPIGTSVGWFGFVAPTLPSRNETTPVALPSFAR